MLIRVAALLILVLLPTGLGTPWDFNFGYTIGGLLGVGSMILFYELRDGEYDHSYNR